MEKLGSGHSGSVYRAITSSDEEVAAKIAYHSDALVHEQRVLQRLSADPRACTRVVQFCGMEKTVYGDALLMRFEHGGTLAAAVARTHPMGLQYTELSLFVATVAEIADSLDAIHNVSVVHGDVKADNILLSYSKEFNKEQTSCVETPAFTARLILADLGEAKLLEDPSTFWLLPPGAPHFNCPVDVASRNFSSRSDSWALAQVAFELWTGDRPSANPTNLPDAMPLVDILRRCQSQAPEQRPACAEVRDVAEALLIRLNSSRGEQMRHFIG